MVSFGQPQCSRTVYRKEQERLLMIDGYNTYLHLFELRVILLTSEQIAVYSSVHLNTENMDCFIKVCFLSSAMFQPS